MVADNTLNQNGFEDAIRTVLTQFFTPAQADAWVVAIIAEAFRLELCNQATYASFRNQFILGSTAQRAEDLFAALSVTINALPDTVPASISARLVDLREDRDAVNAALTHIDTLIAAEPAGVQGRLVKTILREGKDTLRGHREAVRADIGAILGDPDA